MLSGKTALVTGGVGDLGHAMAIHLAKNGADVIVWDVKPAEDVHDEIAKVKEYGTQINYQVVDVRDRETIDARIAEIEKLDIVCANAGIVAAQPFLEVTLEKWNRHLDINLTGCFNVCQSAARKMVAEKTQGRIILTSSWVGIVPWPELSAYTVSKAGVNMLTKQMARELASHGIRVNAVAPGIVEAGLSKQRLIEDPESAVQVAKMIPLGERGNVTEIAEAVIYLASPQTAYMTGSILTIDGGCSLYNYE